jgi:hypothetical protein
MAGTFVEEKDPPDPGKDRKSSREQGVTAAIRKTG